MASENELARYTLATRKAIAELEDDKFVELVDKIVDLHDETESDESKAVLSRLLDFAKLLRERN